MKYALATVAALALAAPAFAEEAKTPASKPVVSTQGSGLLAGGLGVGASVGLVAALALVTVAAASSDSSSASGT
ncbi:hypothetical protein E4Z66_14740 [Aliishimia ponticola]|uniref:Ferrochelatase n=1 Tax=Aliishimia ponticola TaxID=2499833 RepID=A0A4S4N937_9RHOB|nr:hypothetical protein [Aliishimia ponticola]THH35085.1 hypothetical protein E4Z66_14740 [Aliishimia ponticola]